MSEERRDGETTRYWYAECVGCQQRRVVGLEGVGLWELAIASMARDHGRQQDGLLVYLEGSGADERFIGAGTMPTTLGVRDDMEPCPLCGERPEVEVIPEGPLAWAMTCGCGVLRAVRSRTFADAKEVWSRKCHEMADVAADLDELEVEV